MTWASTIDRNFEPGWGLYNNSTGTVRDIVFAPGDDPNSGDLPQYVAVEFSHYTGPVWDPENPKVGCNTVRQKFYTQPQNSTNSYKL